MPKIWCVDLWYKRYKKTLILFTQNFFEFLALLPSKRKVKLAFQCNIETSFQYGFLARADSYPWSLCRAKIRAQGWGWQVGIEKKEIIDDSLSIIFTVYFNYILQRTGVQTLRTFPFTTESNAALSQLISISLFLEGEGGWELDEQ